MKKLYILLFTILITSFAFSQVINEVDADTPGTDAAEFIEISWTASTALDGLVVVLFNGGSTGTDNTSYAAYDLDGKLTDANGFFILAGTALVSGSDIDMGATNTVQNGADAVALYTGSDTDFPNGTAVTATNLLSGVVYDTNDADNAVLLAAIGGVQYNEDENILKDTQSIQRKMDGTYEVKNITFRDDNSAAVCDLSLSTTSAICDAVTMGVDTYTATVDFVGGGTSTYTVSSDFGSVDLSGGDPDVDATGTITVTGLNEGTDVTITVVDAGVCNLMSTVTTPSCEPIPTLPIVESFSYSDGSLVPNGGWANHSGNTGDLLISSGQAVVTHGTPSEDANLEFATASRILYCGLDFSVDDLGAPYAGTDNEYFFHFMEIGTFEFMGRFDIVAPTGVGDFSVGIASGDSTADATWASDLTFGTTYRAVIKIDMDTNQAQLWIDAVLDSDTSILGDDLVDDLTIAQNAIGFRQSDSDENETVRVDNVKISTTFNAVVLGANDFETNNFKIYPNPTSLGFVNISSKNSETINVNVFDILGKQVINTTVSNNKLDVSNLNAGIYIMRITQNNATVTKKLVIQ